MYRFQLIEIYNFITHKHSILDMRDNNSVFIGGDNKDAPSINSNGSGKSLIFDAIYWCLYDSTVRGFGKDKVIGENDDHTYVKTVWIDDDNRKIEIQRYRKHPKFNNDVIVTIDGQQASKTKNLTSSGTNVFISKMFGMTDIAFLYSSIFSKSRLSICDKKPAERIKLLSHIIGLDIIDEGLKAARKDRKNLNDQLHRIDIKISAEKTRGLELKKRINDIEDSIRNAEVRRKKQVNFIKKKNKKIDEKIKKLIKKRANVHNKSEKIAKQAIAQMKAQEKLHVVKEMRQKALEKLAKLSVTLEERMEIYQAARKNIIATKAGSGTECPLCRQYIEPSHVRNRLVDLKKDMHVKNAAKRRTAKTVNNFGKKIKKFNNEINEIESLVDNSLDSQLLKLESKEKEYKKEIKILKKSKLEISEDNELSELQMKLSELNKTIEESRKKYIHFMEKYKKLSEELMIVEFWIDGFGPKGLKRFVINSILSMLEEKTNEFLNEITDGYINVEWDSDKEGSKKIIDQLHINVKIGNGEKRDYHCCSEGEKARIWLATELALNDIRKITIDVAFVDECFDGLDKQGVQKAIKLITGESMKRKMVCISHREGVEKFFTKKNVVIMEKGISTLKAA